MLELEQIILILYYNNLELYSTSQLQPRIILSGQEFKTNTAITSGGIALLCGVNQLNSR